MSVDYNISQEGYSMYEYEFENPKYLIMDGKTYSLKIFISF
jgi:hypothetical protein